MKPELDERHVFGIEVSGASDGRGMQAVAAFESTPRTSDVVPSRRDLIGHDLGVGNGTS
jgi:hypothetical protein